MLFVAAEIVALIAYFGWEAFKKRKQRQEAEREEFEKSLRFLRWEQKIILHHCGSLDLKSWISGDFDCAQCGKRPG